MASRTVIVLGAVLGLMVAVAAGPAPAAENDREVGVQLAEGFAAELGVNVKELTVELRKKHADGKQTLAGATVAGSKQVEKRIVLSYPKRKGDEGEDWLRYEYRSLWSFEGGGSHETEWQTVESPYVIIQLPYTRERLDLIGDVELLKEQGVRRIIVEVEYAFFGKKRRKEKREFELDTPLEGEHIDVAFPMDSSEYQYRIRWMPGRLESRGTTDSTVLVLDELPEEEER